VFFFKDLIAVSIFDEAYRILTETPSVERYVKSTIFLALKSREFREEEEKYAGLLLRAIMVSPKLNYNVAKKSVSMRLS
jgi:hypothetical protein